MELVIGVTTTEYNLTQLYTAVFGSWLSPFLLCECKYQFPNLLISISATPIEHVIQFCCWSLCCL